MASLEPSEENYYRFMESKSGRLVKKGEWKLAPDGMSWIPAKAPAPRETGGVSSNSENNDLDGFHYHNPETLEYVSVSLYDEIGTVENLN